METMEQAIKKEFKEGYWITGVDYPTRRAELILTLRVLSNSKWQEIVYTSIAEGFTPGLNGEYGIHYTLYEAMQLILEDLCLDNFIKNNEYPYKQIGWWLKSKKEAENLLEVAILIDKLYESVNPNYDKMNNEKYLLSPYLHKLRKSSEKTFNELMKNEKNNKKFVKYINQGNNEIDKDYIKLTQSNDTSETRI